MTSPELRSRLVLAVVALAALAASFLLAFAFSRAPRPISSGSVTSVTIVEPRFSVPAQNTAVETPSAAPAKLPVSTVAQAPSVLRTAPAQPSTLWSALTPFAFAIDAIAVLGLAVVLLVRPSARRRRSGART